MSPFFAFALPTSHVHAVGMRATCQSSTSGSVIDSARPAPTAALPAGACSGAGWISARPRRRKRDNRRGAPPGHCPPQIADGFGPLQSVLRQFDAEFPLGAPQHQFHPRQAVESEVVVEPAVQCHGRQAGRAGTQIAQRGLDQRHQPVGVDHRWVTVGLGDIHHAAASGFRS